MHIAQHCYCNVVYRIAAKFYGKKIIFAKAEAQLLCIAQTTHNFTIIVYVIIKKIFSLTKADGEISKKFSPGKNFQLYGT